MLVYFVAVRPITNARPNQATRETETSTFVSHPSLSPSAVLQLLNRRGRGGLLDVSLCPLHPTPMDGRERQRFPDTQIFRLAHPELYDWCCCNWSSELPSRDEHFTVSHDPSYVNIDS